MNEIKKKLPLVMEDKNLSALADSIANMVNEAKSHFYLLFYLIFQTLSRKLSWSHICELITIDDDLECSFYESGVLSFK